MAIWTVSIQKRKNNSCRRIFRPAQPARSLLSMYEQIVQQVRSWRWRQPEQLRPA